MKGTKIESSIWGRHIEYDPDLGIEPAPIGADETEIKVNISPEESKGEATLSFIWINLTITPPVMFKMPYRHERTRIS